MPAAIAIVGSLNMDFIVHVDRLPQPGETLLGSGFEMLPGGKGANQAYAVARLGGTAAMIGSVGKDLFGQQLILNLESVGVECAAISKTPASTTGTAMIAVEKSGQNQIVVAPGANNQLDPHHVLSALNQIDPKYLLLQLEIPIEIVERTLALARSRNIFTILDPAPARALEAHLLSFVDLLTPNESEALCLLGRTGNRLPLEQAPEVAEALHQMGPKRVVLKLGENGAWFTDGNYRRHFPAPTVLPIDVTAAGDTFNGALSVALAEGHGVDWAIEFANKAAALSVTKPGAQASIPSRQEVDRLHPTANS
ncbi:MAG: ribokinase [Terriglobia bacterium]